MHRLVNGTQGYDWGSTDLIPRFLGAEPDGSPVAEIWVGTHPLLPSSLADDERPLQEVAGRLPFLLKVLAAAKPLSLQVHPDKGHARRVPAHGRDPAGARPPAHPAGRADEPRAA